MIAAQVAMIGVLVPVAAPAQRAAAEVRLLRRMLCEVLLGIAVHPS
jgi:hypothetical protein